MKATTTATAIKTKSIKAKNSGCNETVWNNMPSQVVKRTVKNASGTVDGIKLKLSACVEEDAEETRSSMRILLLLLLQLLLLHKLRVLRGSF